MKLAYLDSSVLLSIIFSDEFSQTAENIFKEYEWVSSLLLYFECTNVIIRESSRQSGSQKLLRESLGFLDKLIDHVNIIPMDRSIINKILSDKRISQGRTLDSIHIASALVIQENYEDKLKLATFDKRLSELAGQLGIDNVMASV